MMMAMENNILFQLCLITIASATANFPQVYEDQIEYNRNNEYIRIVRNPQVTYKARANQPRVFHFGTANQQDYLRHKYAEQQMVDMARIAAIQARNRDRYLKPQTFTAYQPIRRSKKDTEGWQPFDPNIPKVNTEQTATVNSKNVSEIVDEVGNNNDKLSMDVTETEESIKRNDSPDMLKSAIFVHPNLLMHNFNKNIKGVPQILDVNVKNSATQISVLNELIGKNPNVQLEGLKRLLQQPSSENMGPVIKSAKPFQLKDQNPIATKMIDIPNTQNKPNMQVHGIYPEVRLPQLPPVINRESLEDLQKQFDDASKLQIEQALARAQEEAQAQVEAQHKAIALAQAEAQKTALENFQKGLYSVASPTAAPLIQENVQVQNPVKPQASHISQVAVSQQVSSYPSKIQKQNLAEQELQDLSSEHRPQLIHLPIPLETQDSSQLHNSRQLYYAPNHQHQADEIQDEKGFSIQPQAQTVTILEKPDDQPESIERNEETNNHDDLIIIQTTSRPESINDAFQQSLDPEETRRVKKLYVSEEETNYDDPEEYAARYAFGYRIKDAEEGNDFGHEERRNGKSAEGSYHVLLPDGRLQKVQYYADKSGYHAKVTYEQVGHKE